MAVGVQAHTSEVTPGWLSLVLSLAKGKKVVGDGVWTVENMCSFHSNGGVVDSI